MLKTGIIIWLFKEIVFYVRILSVVIFCLFLFPSISISQITNSETLSNKSFDELKKLYGEVPKDSIKAKELIALTYVEKSKKLGDSINLARGYYFFSMMYNEPRIGIKYADSIIVVTKNSLNESFPAVGYFLRGYWNYRLSDYKNALNNYLIGDSIAQKRGNIQQQMQNRKMIAALKNRAGDYDGALDIYLKELDSLKKIENKNSGQLSAYLNSLYNTSLTYLHLEKIDSARRYTEQGINESLNVGDSTTYYDFIFNLGTIEYLAGNKDMAENKLNEALFNIDDYSKTMAYYYLGKIKYDKGLNDSAIDIYKVSDSLANELNYSFPEMHDAYESIISYYEDSDDLEQQLLYINKLLKLDSTLNNSKDLRFEISRKYDRPILLRKKEAIIDNLNSRNKKGNITIIILAFLAIIFVIAFLLIRRKQKIYERNYKELIKERNTSFKQDSTQQNIDITNNIPKEVYEKLKIELDKFEKEKGYLKSITLSELAKKLDSNTTYLSKFINENKGQNFSQYLNEIRIDYIVDRLKVDSRLRSYTIKAIAEEAGYGTAQSFSKSFYQQTGIYPSYFIKKLNSVG